MLVTKEMKKSIKEADLVKIKFVGSEIRLITHVIPKRKGGWEKEPITNKYIGKNSLTHSGFLYLPKPNIEVFNCHANLGDEWKLLNLAMRDGDSLFFKVKIEIHDFYTSKKLLVTINRNMKNIISNFAVWSNITK